MKTINVGVAGVGFMGATHLKSWLKIPGVRVVAVANAKPLPPDGDLSSIAGNIGSGAPLKLDLSVVRVYDDFAPLLADGGVDLLDLCVPTPLHHPLALAALNAGRHVICEKPLARTAAQGREIAAAARTAPGFFMPAMVMRFWPGWAWLKEMIDTNAFGKVLAARFRRVSPPPAWGRENYFDGAKSGGALLDLHIHDSDFVQFCFGRPTAVFSAGVGKFSGLPDHVATSYRVASGAAVTAEGSWLMADGHGFNMEYTVNFERATADYNLARGAEALKVFEEGKPARVETFPASDGYELELRYMVDCIQRGVRPSVVTAEDGVSALEICEAEAESIQRGALVPL